MDTKRVGNRPDRITVTLFDGNEELEIELPSKFDVCDRCEGHGTHLNPSLEKHAYTMEEFRESFDDEEAEEYFTRGGMYDVKCEECNGNRVVPVVDEARLTAEQKELYTKFQEQQAERAKWDRVARDERRMGA